MATVNAARFDGINDILKRASDWIGSPNSNQVTWNFWVKRNTINAQQRILNSNGNRYVVEFQSDNLLRFRAEDSINTELLLAITSVAFTDTTSWHHVVASFDLSNSSNRHIYIDDVLDGSATYTTYINDTIDFATNPHHVGASVADTVLLDADLAELWMAPGVYINLSIETNRRKFISSDLKAMDLGADGSLPTGNPPLVYLANPFDSFELNLGTGGDYTVTGALAEAVGPEAASSTVKITWAEMEVPPAGSAFTVVQAVETDTARAITVERGVDVGLAAETDTAQALGSSKTKALGQAEETDTAPAVTADRAHDIGIATETDTAFSLAGAVQIGIASETDTAFALAERVAVGIAAETDTAPAVTIIKIGHVEIASEIDLAQALTSAKAKALGLASETDTARPIAVTRAVQLGLADETDTATGLGSAKVKALGLSSETDTAQPIASVGVGQIGIAAETDTATSLSRAKAKAIGLASETDTAGIIVGREFPGLVATQAGGGGVSSNVAGAGAGSSIGGGGVGSSIGP